MLGYVKVVYQNEPRGVGCKERITPAELVFAAMCGHETCPSTAWHYHHFMQAREVLENAERTGGDPGKAMWHLLQVLQG
jgi:hypothetical protein